MGDEERMEGWNEGKVEGERENRRPKEKKPFKERKE